jgi:transcriptional regulator with XRE-family HTH domain
MLVYTKIKQICERKGVSVASVERDAGLTNGSISKWDNSKPIAESLHSVAKVLGTTVEDLLEEKEV